MCCGCDRFHYSAGSHPTFSLSWTFLEGVVAASHAGHPDSSMAPGVTSVFERSVNVHHGTLLFASVPLC